MIVGPARRAGESLPRFVAVQVPLGWRDPHASEKSLPQKAELEP